MESRNKPVETQEVLIVDNEDSNRALLSNIFTEKGIKFSSAGSAEEALYLLGGTGSISLAYVDISIKGGRGLELLEKIKFHYPEIEVIFTTNRPTLETSIEVFRKGAFDYIPKPFANLEEVWETAKRALEKNALSAKKRALFKDLETRNENLSTAAQRLTVLNEAGRTLSSTQSLPKILDCLIELASQELGVNRASLMLIQKDTDDLFIAASRGLDPSLPDKVKCKIGEGIAGLVAKMGKPLLVRDVKGDSRVENPLHSTAANSFISSPILLSTPSKPGKKTLGVINVTNKRNGEPFTHEDKEFLQSLAGQAAVPIEEALNFERLQQTPDALKLREDQNLKNERLKGFCQLAGGIAHEFNNLLNSILGNSQLIQMELSEPSPNFREIQKELYVIEELATKGAEIVRRLEDFTGIRKDLPTEQVDLNKLVQRSVEIAEQKWAAENKPKGIFVDVVTDPGDIPKVLGNAVELTQVIRNLISNGLESMLNGGRLTLRTTFSGNFVCLAVSDSGIGMDKETRTQIFEPFFTRKPGRTGLGLSFVRGTIERYGGKITLNSTPGNGTVFNMLLPASSLASGWGKGMQTQGTTASKTGTILIVEDDAHNRRLFEKIMKLEGHQVLTASDGYEGIEILKKKTVDLLVTDLSMPGISGWKVAKKAKKINPNTHVILFSGWGIQVDPLEAKVNGVDTFLSKPCAVEDLQKTIRQSLRKQQTPG